MSSSILNIIGKFHTYVKVNEFDLEIDFYVVSEHTMTCLLGRNFINNNKLNVIFGETVTITKFRKKSETETNNECNNILHIIYI